MLGITVECRATNTARRSTAYWSTDDLDIDRLYKVTECGHSHNIRGAACFRLASVVTVELEC